MDASTVYGDAPPLFAAAFNVLPHRGEPGVQSVVKAPERLFDPLRIGGISFTRGSAGSSCENGHAAPEHGARLLFLDLHDLESAPPDQARQRLGRECLDVPVPAEEEQLDQVRMKRIEIRHGQVKNPFLLQSPACEGQEPDRVRQVLQDVERGHRVECSAGRLPGFIFQVLEGSFRTSPRPKERRAKAA